MKLKIYLAEAIGTAILVLGGCGVAMAFGIVQAYGPLSVALAFGLSLALVAFMFGSISGAHVNPAVTIALALSNKF